MKMALTKLEGKKVDTIKFSPSRLKELEKQKETLYEKYAIEGMRKEIFEKFEGKLNKDIVEIISQMGNSNDLQLYLMYSKK